MADKVDKPKKSKAKPKKDEQGVLAALPSTRPERIGTRRVSAPKTFEEPAAEAAAARSATKPGKTAAAAAKPGKKTAAAKPGKKTAAVANPVRTTAAKASAPPKTSAAAKPVASSVARRPRAETSGGPAAKPRKPVAPRTFEPTRAAESAAGAADAPPPSASVPPARASESRPRAVREGAPGMGTSGARDEPASERGRPGGVELVTTAVQAVGELTQVGLKVGGRFVKRAVDRLPKP